jgi:hypothetical protein
MEMAMKDMSMQHMVVQMDQRVFQVKSTLRAGQSISGLVVVQGR